MPASSTPSVHEDAPTSRDVDDDQHSSYNPPISTSSQRRLPKLTPARLVFFAATLGLGIPKAVASAEGQETVANILDLNLGVVWPCVAYCLSIFENECPQVAPWFLEYDLFQIDPIFLEIITWVTVIASLYVFVPFLSNPSLFSNPALPIIRIGVGFTALVVYLVLRTIKWMCFTLLLILLRKVRLVSRKVHHFAYNTVNRYHHHFATFHKACMAGVLLFFLLQGPLQYLSLHGGQWIIQVAMIWGLIMFLPSILFMFIILYNGGLESYVQFVFGPPSSNPSHEPQSVLLEEIVVDPARCEIEPVNPSSDSNSNETVDGSIRLCRTQGPFLPHSHQGMEPRRSARIRNIHTQELSGPSTSTVPPLPTGPLASLPLPPPTLTPGGAPTPTSSIDYLDMLTGPSLPTGVVPSLPSGPLASLPVPPPALSTFMGPTPPTGTGPPMSFPARPSTLSRPSYHPQHSSARPRPDPST